MDNKTDTSSERICNFFACVSRLLQQLAQSTVKQSLRARIRCCSGAFSLFSLLNSYSAPHQPAPHALARTAGVGIRGGLGTLSKQAAVRCTQSELFFYLLLNNTVCISKGILHIGAPPPRPPVIIGKKDRNTCLTRLMSYNSLIYNMNCRNTGRS
jgi:hypothetical protein